MFRLPIICPLCMADGGPKPNGAENAAGETEPTTNGRRQAACQARVTEGDSNYREGNARMGRGGMEVKFRRRRGHQYGIIACPPR